MDPNLFFAIIGMGAALGIFLGFMVSGEGYGWFFNAVAGAVGAYGGGLLLAHAGMDMGPLMNAGVAACAASSLTALVLRA